jgi:hypothetical protein
MAKKKNVRTGYSRGGKYNCGVIGPHGKPTGHNIDPHSGRITDIYGRDTGYCVGDRYGSTILDSGGKETGFFLGGKTGSEILGPSNKLPFMK